MYYSVTKFLDTFQSYQHLVSTGLTEEICLELFSSGDHSWKLAAKPCKGFYLELLRYQQAMFKHLSKREVGRVFQSIDPWMASSIAQPENAHLKIWRMKRQKRLDQTAEMAYNTKPDHSPTLSPVAMKESDPVTPDLIHDSSSILSQVSYMYK